MPEELIRRYCPLCREERDFRRVVEAHEETEPFTLSTPMGVPLRQWVQKTSHPTAYCSVCRIVVYVGPSEDEVEEAFQKREEEKQRKEEEEHLEAFRIQLGPLMKQLEKATER